MFWYIQIDFTNRWRSVLSIRNKTSYVQKFVFLVKWLRMTDESLGMIQPLVRDSSDLPFWRCFLQSHHRVTCVHLKYRDRDKIVSLKGKNTLRIGKISYWKNSNTLLIFSHQELKKKKKQGNSTCTVLSRVPFYISVRTGLVTKNL